MTSSATQSDCPLKWWEIAIGISVTALILLEPALWWAWYLLVGDEELEHMEPETAADVKRLAYAGAGLFFFCTILAALYIFSSAVDVGLLALGEMVGLTLFFRARELYNRYD